MPQLDHEQVREALYCLYEDVDLCQTDLAAAFPEATEMNLGKRALTLRGLLLQAIEALCPARRRPFGSLESRSYDVLTLRYVENMPIRQIAEELGLSERQVHRDIWRAEERLSALVNDHLPAEAQEETGPNPFEDELEYLRSQPTQVRLATVLRSVIDLVEPLAQQLSRRVQYTQAREDPVLVAADQALLKQVLAQLVSCALQASAGDVTAQLAMTETASLVRLGFRLSDPALLEKQLAPAQRIAASQGFETSLDVENGWAAIQLRVRAGVPDRVLIVEDNPGSVELYRRYLSAGNWQVHTASDPRLALALARETRPDVIVLDIMMPKMDGWSILESLAKHESTKDIPVLVCSVVEDERLGRALGASVQLCKPVSRGQFLGAIRQCLQGG